MCCLWNRFLKLFYKPVQKETTDFFFSFFFSLLDKKPGFIGKIERIQKETAKMFDILLAVHYLSSVVLENIQVLFSSWKVVPNSKIPLDYQPKPQPRLLKDAFYTRIRKLFKLCELKLG